jgi:hypothetical protein
MLRFLRSTKLWLGIAIFLLSGVGAWAQVAEQFLPEVDLYYLIPADNQSRLPDTRLWFQAKNTREAGDPVSAEFGPSVELLLKSWHLFTAIPLFDIDESKSRPLILSAGYRYLPNTSGPPTNRFEPFATFNAPLHRVKVLFTDRNRFDLDWKGGGYSWRYRNRPQFQREISLGRYHISPYASAEFFYESQYSKWSNTAIYAGCYFHFGEHFQLNPYYEHQNFTGSAPNQQYNQFGLMLNLFYGRR